MAVNKQVTAAGTNKYTMIESGNLNCFEFYLKNTEQYGEYFQFQHCGKRYYRSEFIRDVKALAAYFKNELKLKRGDAYTVFMPTNIESLMAFYALNSIGVITNFVHPLLPPEALEEAVNEAGSKGIMIMGLISVKYESYLNCIKLIAEKNLPTVVCRGSTYASFFKHTFGEMGEALLELKNVKIKNKIGFDEIIRKYRNKPYIEYHNNGLDTAVYLNGGGTTGKSKTIKLTGKAINETVYKLGYIDEIHEPGEEAEVIVLPFFHAFGLNVAGHMAMCNAARIIPMLQFDGKLLVKLMKKNRVVGIIGIPNMFKKMMKQKGFDGEYLKNTRMMFAGGDDMSPAFMEEFNSFLAKNGTDARLRQGYGLTETGSVCCTNTNWDNKDGSIGKPLADVTIQIWDDNHNEVPCGEVGEIAITGSIMMSGYLTPDRQEKAGLYTDEKGTDWVLSGDLGYKDEDGYLWFAGRKKRVIIISGYNAYPVDIENLMDTLPYIKESCAVQGWENGKSIIRLYVSLLKEVDKEAVKKEITALCEEKLSKFSVPREIVFMDELPHTPLEKVDFMALTELKPKDKK